MSPAETRARNALALLIPILDRASLRWVITGGFACYVYGVKRELTDIDIDLDASKDSPAFRQLYAELTPHITSPLEHFVDQNYDNYNFEATIEGQLIDMCPIHELNLFSARTGAYEPFYTSGFPKVEMADFFGLSLPLLTMETIIANKEMLPWQREADRKDIEGLRALMEE